MLHFLYGSAKGVAVCTHHHAGHWELRAAHSNAGPRDAVIRASPIAHAAQPTDEMQAAHTYALLSRAHTMVRSPVRQHVWAPANLVPLAAPRPPARCPRVGSAQSHWQTQAHCVAPNKRQRRRPCRQPAAACQLQCPAISSCREDRWHVAACSLAAVCPAWGARPDLFCQSPESPAAADDPPQVTSTQRHATQPARRPAGDRSSCWRCSAAAILLALDATRSAPSSFGIARSRLPLQSRLTCASGALMVQSLCWWWKGAAVLLAAGERLRHSHCARTDVPRRELRLAAHASPQGRCVCHVAPL